MCVRWVFRNGQMNESLIVCPGRTFRALLCGLCPGVVCSFPSALNHLHPSSSRCEGHIREETTRTLGQLRCAQTWWSAQARSESHWVDSHPSSTVGSCSWHTLAYNSWWLKFQKFCKLVIDYSIIKTKLLEDDLTLGGGLIMQYTDHIS